MKTSLLYFPFFFLSLVFFACDTDAITFPDFDPDSILGHWDIDGGGTLLFEEENFFTGISLKIFAVLTNITSKVSVNRTFESLATHLIA